MNSPIRSIDDFDSPSATLADSLAALSSVNDRGVRFDEEFIPWSQVVSRANERIVSFRRWAGAGEGSGSVGESRRPPHIGILLDNSPEFVFWLCAAASSELVAVGLNDTRAPRALAADLATADVRVVVYDAGHADLARELARHTAVPVIPEAEFADGPANAASDVMGDGSVQGEMDATWGDGDALVALIFTSGTSGDPKAVRVTQRKISVPAQMLADRFEIGSQD